jgi:opacity protein-like surface antigen
MKRLLIALAAVSVIGTAYAQEAAKPSTDPQTPAVATPDTQNPAAPVAGANSFTEGQAKERIEAKGYTDVSALTKGEDGVWTGTAMKSGKSFEVKLDFQGNITEAAK